MADKKPGMAAGTGRSFIWRRIMDEKSFEHARAEKTARGWRLSGTVLVAEEGQALHMEYMICCDDHWRTETAHIVQSWHGEVRRLSLRQDSPGRWSRDGMVDETLDGCTDIDLGLSPITNTLPIRRLGLAVGDTAEIKAAWVLFPALEVKAARQTYEREREQSYIYRSVTSGFRARLDVDDEGFTREYEGIWTRIAEGGLTLTPQTDGFASALMAAGPATSIGRSQASTFDWLIGGWRAEVRDYDGAGGFHSGTGEWWFSWVLEGRAIQDVWISPPRADRNSEQRAANRYGTTLRWYDSKRDLWHVQWINPVSGVETRLMGRREGNRVLMTGEEGGMPIRWYFEEVTTVPVVWKGEEQHADGSWHLTAEFILTPLG